MKFFPCLLLSVLLLAGCGAGDRASSGTAASSSATASTTATAPGGPPPELAPAGESGGEAAAAGPRSGPEPPGSSAENSAPPVEIRTLTIPEGYTLARIGMTLEEQGVCTAQEFLAAAQAGDFSAYPLVTGQETDPNRCFALEGYLFPDTYEFYSIETPDAIIRRILANTESKLTPALREQIAASGLTADEVLTLASIIEKEAFGEAQMPAISSVLHNRLNQGMKLQCDVTITYVEGAIKPFITGDVDRYNEYYNTYKCPALPAGPICNPGLAAIRAALSPIESDYLYFVTDGEKNYYYAATWEEHERNVAAAAA